MHALIIFDEIWKVVASKIISKVLQNDVTNNSLKKQCRIFTEIHQKITPEPRKIRFHSIDWPAENQSTLTGLPTSRCIKKPHPETN